MWKHHVKSPFGIIIMYRGDLAKLELGIPDAELNDINAIVAVATVKVFWGRDKRTTIVHLVAARTQYRHFGAAS